MDNRDLNKRIREDAHLSSIYKEEVNNYWYYSSSALHTVKYNVADFYYWCKKEGYVKYGIMADYEVSMPTASIRICGMEATIHDLESFGTDISKVSLQGRSQSQVLEFFKRVPRLLETLEYDKQYVLANYQKVREKAKKSEKLAQTKQSIIEAFVRSELNSRQLSYRLERNASRLYVILKIGKYEAKYPIPNVKAENMIPIIEDMNAFIAALSKVPFGLKIKLVR